MCIMPGANSRFHGSHIQNTLGKATERHKAALQEKRRQVKQIPQAGSYIY
jgi:hypothetical protein